MGGPANNPDGSAVGGKGGKGGDVSVRTPGDVIVTGPAGLNNGAAVLTGNGGRGGGATSAGQEAQATGGRGGDAGQPFLVANAFRSPGAAVLVFGFGYGGEGGGADATGSDGANATSATPAEAGGSATAQGGRGGDSGSSRSFTTVHVAGNTSGFGVAYRGIPDLEPWGVGGRGGDADATGGKGGAGSREHPVGGAGGAMTATGGTGGNSAWVILGSPINGVGTGGSPEDITFTGGMGREGFDGCSVEPPAAGGAGGKGGSAMGEAGRAGLGGTISNNTFGDATFTNAGNGGAGGNGEAPGSGGAAGTDGVSIIGGQTRNGTNFQAGANGSGCSPPPPTATAIILTDGGELFVVHLPTKTVVQQLTVTDPADIHRGIARSSDGKTVWIVTEGGTVKALSSATREELVSTTQPAGLKDVTVHPTSGKVYVVNATDGTVTPLNPETGAVDGSPISIASGQQILFPPNGAKGFVRTSSRISMFDPAAGTVTGTPIPLTNATDMAMTPDGSKLYVLHGSGSATVTVIDVATMMVTKTIPLGGSTPSGGLAVSPDGTQVFVNPDLFSNISVISTATDAVTGSIPTASLTDRIAFAVDGLSAVLWGITTLHCIDLLGIPIGAGLDLAYVILTLLMF